MPEVLAKPTPASGPGRGADRPGSGRPMISAARIRRRVRELGREISGTYADIETPLVMVVILKGATVFAADLLRSLSIPAELEFVRPTPNRYGAAKSGRLRLAHMVAGSLVGRHVLLVMDIVDSGITVDTVARRIGRLDPASLRIATLLDRPAYRQVEVDIDFCGFVIPDRFVIGYGIDYAGLYRELPDLHSLK